MTLTKEQRLQVYKQMLELAIEDRKLSMSIDSTDDLLWGLCYCLLKALRSLHFDDSIKISEMPELIALKPKNKNLGQYWWSYKPTSMTRINKLKKIISEMETN